MKKKLILLLAVLCTMTAGFAEDKVEVGSITVPQSGNGSFDIVLKNSTEFVAFTMKLTLPEGVVYDGFVQGERIKGETVSDNVDGSVITLARLSAQNDAFTGNDGVLLTINVHTTEALKTGDEVNATLTELTFTTADEQESTLADATFTITIGEPVDSRVVLDENSTAEPTPADHVDVRVKRTLTAGVWNTICLPFSMTEAQVKTTFGDDVLLGDFKGYQLNADNSISVEFDQVNAIAENHPYIIKVATDMDEFELDDVNINPQDAEINLGTKRRPKSIIGTYVAETVIDNGCLFLNGGKFWYSTGITVTQGYRAYFDFDDLLPEFEDNYVNARMRIVLNEESLTKVSTMKQPVAKGGRIHNLQGMQVEQLGKGVFIKDGKVIINN